MVDVVSHADLLAALGKTFLRNYSLEKINGSTDLPAALAEAQREYDNVKNVQWLQQISGRWVRADLPNFKIWLKMGDLVSMAALRGSFEPELTRMAVGFLKKDSIAIDLGANIGWYTLSMAARLHELGGGAIYAFEPQPDIFENLIRSIVDSGFGGIVRAHDFAITDKAQIINMRRSETNMGGGYIWNATDGATFGGLRTMSFDALPPFSKKVDFVKMDIEGAEPLFVRGGRQFLAHHRPVILSEINHPKLKAVSGVTADDFVAELKALGYGAKFLTPSAERLDMTAELLHSHETINVLFLPG
jgi:FkbM family methyltransferase